jgi:hypothetical protein
MVLPGNTKAKTKGEEMKFRLNRNHFSPTEISIPDGEPFDEFLGHCSGTRRIQPKGRFLILEDEEEVVRDGGDTFISYIPAGTYEMVYGGCMYRHTIIRRLGDLPPEINLKKMKKIVKLGLQYEK